MNLVSLCRVPCRRRLAGAERGSRLSQGYLNSPSGRVRATKHAPRSPSGVLERIHGLADILERGAVVSVERLRVKPPQLEREIMTLPENTLRHGHRLAQQHLGFFEAPQSDKGPRVVVGC